MSTGSCGTLVVTAVEASNLKNLQKLLAQDPFVQLTLLPWGDVIKTSAASGVNPVWKAKHHNVMELNYPGRPVPPDEPELLVEVMDAEVTRAARLIGGTTVKLTNLMRGASQPGGVNLELKLKDGKGVAAGMLKLDMRLVLKGGLQVTVLGAHKLNNLQRFFDQDPYVCVTLLPTLEGKRPKAKQTRAASGVNPVFTRKHKNVLRFEYEGEEEPRLLVEVYDKEMIQKDRLLGKGAVDLVARKALSFKATGEMVTEMSVDLVDEEFRPSGRVSIEVQFSNSSFDPRKAIVRGLTSANLMSTRDIGSMTSGDVWTELKRAYFYFLSELEDSAPDFMHEAFGSSGGLPVTVVLMAAWIAASMLAVIVLVTRGAKFLSLLVGVLAPSYQSFKAVESVDKDDDTQWLTYWVVFGATMILDESVFMAVSKVQPTFYFFAKMAFIYWLAHPTYKGALVMYRTIVQPVLRRYEERIDRNLKMAHDAVKDLDNRIRLDSDPGQDIETDNEHED